MVILGYSKKEMEHIEACYEKEYWRIWNLQEKLQSLIEGSQSKLSRQELSEHVPYRKKS